MSKQNFQTIEINGTKFEVDLSTAKKIEEFKVGDKVKVLKKEYSDSFKIYPGVIIGFDWFKENPTIVIAYIEIGYKECNIHFLYYNKQSKDVEISHTDNMELLIKPSDVIEKMDKEVEVKKAEIRGIETKKQYFLKNFGQYFKEFVPEELKDLL